MIAIKISGQSRSRSSPPLSSMRFSSIFRVNYPLAIIFPWRSISMVSSGRRRQLSHLCELKRIQSSETSFGWAVYNVPIFYFASGFDFWCGSPEGTNFHNFWPNERDSPLRVFVGCKCKFCDNCSFRPAPQAWSISHNGKINQIKWKGWQNSIVNSISPPVP